MGLRLYYGKIMPWNRVRVWAVKSVSLHDIPPVTATGKLGEAFRQA